MGPQTTQQQEYESPRIERVGTIAELTGGWMGVGFDLMGKHGHHPHSSGT